MHKGLRICDSKLGHARVGRQTFADRMTKVSFGSSVARLQKNARFVVEKEPRYQASGTRPHDPAEFSQVVGGIRAQHVCKHRCEDSEVKIGVLVGEAEKGRRDRSGLVVVPIGNVHILKSKIRVAPSDMLLAPVDTASHDVEAFVGAGWRKVLGERDCNAPDAAADVKNPVLWLKSCGDKRPHPMSPDLTEVLSRTTYEDVLRKWNQRIASTECRCHDLASMS